MGLSAIVIGWVGAGLTSAVGGVLSSAVIGGIATVEELKKLMHEYDAT